MNAQSPRSLLACASLLAASAAFAAEHGVAHSGHQAASTAQAAAGTSTELTDGEVRRIDSANKKVTIKHDEIKSIAMPAMTMVFQVRDPAALDKLKVGGKVKFAVEKVNGALVVTQAQPAQ